MYGKRQSPACYGTVNLTLEGFFKYGSKVKAFELVMTPGCAVAKTCIDLMPLMTVYWLMSTHETPGVINTH